MTRLTVIVAGRNDNYGGDFDARLFRTVAHNAGLLAAAGIDFEYVLAEWNPVPGRPLLSTRFTEAFAWARAVVIDPEVHRDYARNAAMPFFEMPAKNAALRRARGEWTIVTNADILFDDALVTRLARGRLDARRFYRAHRIDVPADLSWPELKDPKQQLASGEGRLPPPYYLGAGGDFALAARELWMETTGFNEVVRWTTRAKDWQFFLSVAARGVSIEFIGDVYHLDHESGFRNTPSELRHSPTAHFGGPWDFEFGMPVRNRPDWGLASCQETRTSDRVVRLTRPEDGLFNANIESEDSLWQEWLSAPESGSDAASLWLLHATLAAAQRRCRLIVRPHHPRSAVAAAGMARIAAAHAVQVACSWNWPACTWMRVPETEADPGARSPDDLLLEEAVDGTWTLRLVRGEAVNPVPPPVALNPPRFNPFLCRRLLRALLRCWSSGYRRLAFFGAGGHTDELLAWGVPDWIECRGILTTFRPVGPLRGLPVVQAATFDYATVDAVILSSVTYEAEMLEELARVAPGVVVIPLYSDWPAAV